MSDYTVGTIVRVTASFTNEITGQPGDPTTVTLMVRPLGDFTSTYTYGSGDEVIKRSDTGDYYADLDTGDMTGSCTYQWEGSEGITAGDASSFNLTTLPLS